MQTLEPLQTVRLKGEQVFKMKHKCLPMVIKLALALESTLKTEKDNLLISINNKMLYTLVICLKVFLLSYIISIMYYK